MGLQAPRSPGTFACAEASPDEAAYRTSLNQPRDVRTWEDLGHATQRGRVWRWAKRPSPFRAVRARPEKGIPASRAFNGVLDPAQTSELASSSPSFPLLGVIAPSSKVLIGIRSVNRSDRDNRSRLQSTAWIPLCVPDAWPILHPWRASLRTCGCLDSWLMDLSSPARDCGPTPVLGSDAIPEA